MKTHKIPLRKCIGCQEMKPKQQLIRIVKTKDDIVCLDPTGKANGRGAYICRTSACLEKAFLNKGLERSFHCRISEEEKNQLKKEIQS